VLILTTVDGATAMSGMGLALATSFIVISVGIARLIVCVRRSSSVA
jgi:hypothetical protein